MRCIKNVPSKKIVVFMTSGTIRRDFAVSIDENAVHGSDGPDTAKTEIAYFFSDKELCPRTR